MTRVLLALTAPLALAGSAGAQTTWYVDASATPPGVGTPASPYASIQFAISRPTTVAGDTVLVLPGSYFELLDFLGKAITVESQQGPALTIVDGNQAGSVVTFDSLEGPGSVLRGLRITNGIGTLDSTSSFLDGGGIYCGAASPRIEGCEIDGNGQGFSVDRGGGVFVSAGLPVLEGCRISNNQTNQGNGLGGGLYVASSLGVTLIDCEVDGNFATGGGAVFATTARVDMQGGRAVGNTGLYVGGGFDCVASSNLALTQVLLEQNCSFEGDGGAVRFAGNVLTMTDCRVLGNSVDNDHRGGGVYVEQGSATVSGGEFAGNFSARGGGLSVAAGASATLDGVVFRDNTAQSFQANDGSGGGVHVAPGATAGVARCVFLDNRAISGVTMAAEGGGLFGSVAVDRCTFVGNSASAGGGGVAAAAVSSSILWDNRLADGTPDQLAAGAAAVWSDVQGGAPGTGNIALDPLFWSLFARDVHLMPGSPAIDAGDPGAAPDPDGSRADMGAHPFDPTWVSPPFTYCSGKTTSAGCVPFLDWIGTPSVGSTAPFVVRAVDAVPGEAGLLLYSFDKANVTFHGGKLCLKPPLVRTAAKPAKSVGGGCSGWILSRNFQTTIQGGADPMLTAGQSVFAQWRQRDPGDPSGFGDALTDGMRFTLGP